MSQSSAAGWPAFVGIGIAAGFVSGLLGVGGGLVMVPLLVLAGGFTQHEAHATALAAAVPIAAAAAVAYAIDGQIDLGYAALLASGAIVGAPLGAKVMSKSREGSLKIAFGVLMLVVAATLLLS